MKGKYCLIVLVGAKTGVRCRVKYETKGARAKGLGVMAIHIHNLKYVNREQAQKAPILLQC